MDSKSGITKLNNTLNLIQNVNIELTNDYFLNFRHYTFSGVVMLNTATV